MENVPQYASWTFIAIVITCLGFLFYALNAASPKRKDFTPTIAITFLIIWIFILVILTFNDFFTDFDAFPPRFIFIAGPPLITIFYLLINGKSRAYLMNMPLSTLTYLHIVRVPVEVVLLWLAQSMVFPMALTFEGVNYDILSGISAPLAGLFLFGLRSKSRIGAIAWNLAALSLVLNIVIRAVSATPFFYDPSVYNVPNLAVFSFPYVLLPGLVVPVVIFAHLVSLVKLFGPQEKEEY